MNLVHAALLAAMLDFRLVMKHGPCYGMCPVYTVTITANGAVTFDGEADVGVVGIRKRMMTERELDQLVREVRRVDFFTLGDYGHGSKECHGYWTDNPSVTMTMRLDGREKTVRHYFGCRGFAREQALADFERKVDELAGVEPWKKRDPRIGRRRMAAQMFGVTWCKTGVECENTAADLARNALVLFQIDERRLRIDRDGSVRLVIGRFEKAREVRGKLSAEELRVILSRVAGEGPVTSGAAPKSTPSQRYVWLIRPENGELPIVNAPLDSVPGARALIPLTDEKRWASSP